MRKAFQAEGRLSRKQTKAVRWREMESGWGESGKMVWVKEVPRSELCTLSSIRDNSWRVLREQKQSQSSGGDA